MSEDLERIELEAFGDCPRLRRIVIPLKDNLHVDFSNVNQPNLYLVHCITLNLNDKSPNLILIFDHKSDMNIMFLPWTFYLGLSTS